MTSIASGQCVFRRGVLPGAAIKTPGGSCGNCERSGSPCGVYSLLSLVSSEMRCDILVATLSCYGSLSVIVCLCYLSTVAGKSVLFGVYGRYKVLSRAKIYVSRDFLCQKT